MAKRKNPKKKPATSKSGISFEQAVARIQQAIDPLSKVEHNVHLKDRVGNERQYDVVMRGSFAGRPMLGIIECKDHKRKKGPADVEAFAKKTENLGANLRIIVSRNGFSDQALKLAKHEHIACFSLVPGDGESPHFEMGDFWYGIIKKWTTAQLMLTYAEGSLPLPPGFDLTAVRLDGKSVLNWFLQELFTTYADEERPGSHRLIVKFAAPQAVAVGGIECRVAAVTCVAVRFLQKKRRWVHFKGVGLYDWHTRGITSPAGTTVTSSAVETDLSLWPDYDGEIPSEESADAVPAQGRIQFTLRDDQQVLPEAWRHDISDLRKLGTVAYDEENA